MILVLLDIAGTFVHVASYLLPHKWLPESLWPLQSRVDARAYKYSTSQSTMYTVLANLDVRRQVSTWFTPK